MNTNAVLPQTIDPTTATQTPQQVGTDGISTPDEHVLGALSQHGQPHIHNNNSPEAQPPPMPPGTVAASMTPPVERHGLAQDNERLIEDGSGTNAGVDLRTGPQWSGTVAWRGMDTTRNERREVRTQVTATASKGDPLASTWPRVLLLAPAGPAISIDGLWDWIGIHNPVIMHIWPISEVDMYGYEQLVKLLKYKNCYAIAGWEIPGRSHSTMNLLIAVYMECLLGAVFPLTGLPELPNYRLRQPDPVVCTIGGDISERNATICPKMIDNQQWSGTLIWTGIGDTRNERKEIRAEVTATVIKGVPLASTWPKALSLVPAGPAVSITELHEWMRKYVPVETRIKPTPGTDEHNCGELIKLLRDKACYAVAGWKPPGKARPTMNLLIAPYSQGLLGAAFPITGMPEIPKPRPPQLDPVVRQTIFELLPPTIQNMPEPQLSQAIMQIFVSQRHRFNLVQGGVCSLT